MKTLTGTEKQAAWAEDIRKGYADMVGTLEEAVAVLSDTTQVETTRKNPLTGEEVTTKKYTAELTGSQQATISTVKAFIIKSDQLARQEADQRSIKDIYGFSHEYKGNYRLENRDEVKAMLDTLAEAIETQTEAKFWIDRR